MSIYTDRRFRVRGFGVGLGGGVLAFWLWLLFLPVLAIVYYFPRAVWRSDLEPAAKLLVIGGVWGALAIVGAVSAAHTADQAAAVGCVSTDNLPRWYLAPLDSHNCPLNYTPRLGCQVTETYAPGSGTGRCPIGERPRAVGGGGPGSTLGCGGHSTTVPGDLYGLELDAAESELTGCGITYRALLRRPKSRQPIGRARSGTS